MGVEIIKRFTCCWCGKVEETDQMRAALAFAAAWDALCPRRKNDGR